MINASIVTRECMTKPTKTERAEAIKELQARVRPGMTINCILRNVSTSGMTRHISLFIDDEPITWLAARALGENYTNEWRGYRAIKVTGCGMDIGFNLVYTLSGILFPNGFIPRDAGKTSGRNQTSADEVDTDGGYALNHHWL